MPVKWRWNGAVQAEVRKRSNRAAEVAVNKAADILYERLSKRGTGRKYPQYRFPSSVPGAYPALQSGQLRESIRVSKTGPATYEIRITDREGKVARLEFAPPERGGRPFFGRTLFDPEVHREMLDAVVAAFGKSY